MADRTLQKGEALFIQGEEPRSLFMLKQGSLDILYASSEFEGLDAGIILDKSNRVHSISGKAIMAGYSKMLTGPFKVSARAAETSVIVEVPLKAGGFKAIAAGDLGQSINILRQIYNRLNGIISDAGRFLKLYSTLSSMSDNFSLLYSELSQSNVAPEVHEAAEELYSIFKDSGGSIPQSVDASLLIKDMGSFLNKSYSFNGPPLESLYNKEMYGFLKRLLMLDANILGALLKKDPVITLHMFSSLTDCYVAVMGRISDLYEGIDEAAEKIFGNEKSWTSHLTDEKGFGDWLNSGRVTESFIKNFLSLIVKLNGVYEGISGRKITDAYPGIKKIHEYYSSASSAAQETAISQTADQGFVEPNLSGNSSPTSAASASVMSAMKRSLSQIFEFSMMDKEFQTLFVEELNKFKGQKNPFSTESDGRKLRRRITKMYWDLYKQAYIRSKSEPTVPRPVKLMLNYGYIDETMVEEEQLIELNELARMREGNITYPIVSEPEFLNLIYEDKEEPSITEMGLNYAAYLRELEKSARNKKNVDDNSSAPENIRKTMYEIEQRLASTAAVCSGSTATAFPILTSLAVKGSLKTMHTSKSKVQQIVDDLRNIDFSVFYREVVFKLGDAREIVQTEVLPYFDILPIFGTRTLLWQELSGTNKRSRGRIVIPAFFLGDLSKSIAQTLASFRWELTRSMKGAQWADPIEGGVTGEYFDYVNTYKKNSKLSVEAKVKIKERFRSLRTNRDRFADDYISWIFYEKDGIMKLNTVVREMFYKHIPFPAELRERLENMPAFSHAANRYKNISNRNMQNYIRRYKKYQDENEEYPEDIKKFLEFLKL
jgi:hypothetical protein